jgi:hypothetical protein
MSFIKIHPDQIQLPDFFSKIGDFVFQNLSTGFNINLNRSLSGNFNIYGSLTLDSGLLLSSNPTNNSDSNNNNIVFGGYENNANGINNSIFAGSSNDTSGSNNVIVNGENLSFESGSTFNTSLAGYNNIFSENITGSSIISSREFSSEVSTNHSLLIGFLSGTTIDGDNCVFNKNVITTSSAEAIFSGNLNITGSSIFNNLVSIKNDIKVENSFNTVGTSQFLSGAYFKNGNLYVNANIEFNKSPYISGNLRNVSGLISSTYLTGSNFDCNTLTGTILSGSSSAFLTGSNILTESGVKDSGFISENNNSYDYITVNNNLTADTLLFSANIENIIITGQTGIGFNSMNFDYLKSNSEFVFDSANNNCTTTITSISGTNSNKINNISHNSQFNDVLVAQVGNTGSYLEARSRYFAGVKSGDICIAIAAAKSSNTGILTSGINQETGNFPYIRYARCIEDGYIDIGYYFPNTGKRGGEMAYNLIVIGAE